MFGTYTRLMTCLMKRSKTDHCKILHQSFRSAATRNPVRLGIMRQMSYCKYKHIKDTMTNYRAAVHTGMSSPYSLSLGCSHSSRYFSSNADQSSLVIDEQLISYLSKLEDQYEEAVAIAMDPEKSNKKDLKATSKTITEHKLAVDLFKQLKQNIQELQDLDSIIKGDEQEMIALAMEERNICQNKMEDLYTHIVSVLVPPERADHNDIILEITAGVGGQEAMLFAGEMFDMYSSLVAYKGWQWNVIDYEDNEMGGLRRASAGVSGESVYSYLKYEGGIHRVQRVPQTEKSGRIHTSTMAVAVMPQPSEIDVVLNPKDLKVETFRASGAGGQHVNTTNSAVRVTHIPTGMVTECQVGRSQIKNKSSAMQILRSKLYEKELEAQTQQAKRQRKIQVGSRERSDKIRTYNYSQDRVTDHRIGRSIFNLGEFMTGGELLDSMIIELQEESKKERLQEIIHMPELEITAGKHTNRKKKC